MLRRLALSLTVVVVLAFAGASASAETLSPKAKSLVLIIAKPKLCGEVHSSIDKYGYQAALAGFELAYAEHPAYATPNVFRWVLKEC